MGASTMKKWFFHIGRTAVICIALVALAVAGLFAVYSLPEEPVRTSAASALRAFGQSPDTLSPSLIGNFEFSRIYHTIDFYLFQTSMSDSAPPPHHI